MAADFTAIFGAYGYTVSVASKTNFGFPFGFPTPAELAGCNKGALLIGNSGNVSCPPGDIFSTINAVAYKDFGEINVGCVDPRAWFRDNHLQPDLQALDANLFGAPIRYYATAGGKECEFWLFGCYTDMYPEACWYSIWNGFCLEAYLHKAGVQGIYLLWGLRCSDNPCTMADYNWPLTLSCGCSSTYAKPGVSSTPACVLDFTESSRAYANDKCYFYSTYKGVLESGAVDCNVTPNDNSCKCCGEPL